MLNILDVGCGYGDTLRCIERWATRRCIAVALTGLDLNPDATIIAAEASPAESASSGSMRMSSHISAKAHSSHRQFALYPSSCGDDIVRFLQWMEARANRLVHQRSFSRGDPLSFLSHLLQIGGLHPFVQHDGPVSIARFSGPADWQDCAPPLASAIRKSRSKPSNQRVCASPGESRRSHNDHPAQDR